MEKKSKIRIPHVFVIIMVIILLLCVLTYMAPAGEYVRIEQDGRTIIDVDSFEYVDRTPISPADFITLIPRGMNASVDVIMMLIFSVAGLQVILSTKSIDALLFRSITKHQDRDKFIICVVALTYGIAGAVLGWTYGFIPFIPITIAIANSLGYNRVFGAGLILIPASVGWSSGLVNVYTTAVSQSIAGLPTFSGLWFRLLSLVVFLIMTIIFLLKTANQFKLESVDAKIDQDALDENTVVNFTPKRKIVTLWTLVGFIFLVYTTSKWGWGNQHIAGIFMIIGIIGGLIYGYGPSRISSEFVKGAQSIMGGALTVGLARSVLIVMEEGHLLDTFVHSLGNLLSHTSSVVAAILIVIVITVFNFFVSSANGKVMTMIPILIPLADILGIQRQVIVSAFCFGDGFTNWFWPTAGVIVGSLAAAQVEYEDWMKWTWKIYLSFTVASAILIGFGQIINLGPF